jgi:hypothetical protein
MRIKIQDPLFLTALEGGQVIAPSKSTGASNAGPLEYPQRAVEIGEPVPIAFARRVNNNGGVFISPGASEARFDIGGTVIYSAGTVLEFAAGGKISLAANGSICDAVITGGALFGNATVGNCIVFAGGGSVRFASGGTVAFSTGGSISGAAIGTSSNTFVSQPINLFAYYHLPLSEGVIDAIPVKDVFQASCRVGSHTQTYNRRAGSWAPGNFVSSNFLPSNSQFRNLPQICGSVGLYPDISTLSFVNNTNIYSVNAGKILNQIHIFIRGGMHVTRLLDNITGPSNNFADLAKWLLQRIKRVPDALIDNTRLLESATFLNVNEFTCNIYITESKNYEEYLSQLAPYFLLQPTKINGKRGLKPLLPTNPNGTINTNPIQWDYTFDEKLVVPGSFELEYKSLAERTPFVIQAIWRQQPDDDAGLVRTAEIRYADTAPNGPYESHDLSAFCTNENHAVKAGTYILSSRLNSTHVIRFIAKPQTHAYLIGTSSIIRVTLKRHASGFAESNFDYLYRVIKINKTSTGEVSYECVHFPTDSLGRSIVALDVAGAVGAGYTIQTIRTGVNCDAPTSGGGGSGGSGTDRKDDETVPPEEFIEAGDSNDPSDWEPEYQWYTNKDPEYQWFKDDAEIDGATDQSYTPTSEDIGGDIYRKTTYSDSTTQNSDVYSITAGGVGNKIDPGVEYFEITGATNSTYTPVTADIGSEIYLETTFPDGTVVISNRYVVTADDVGIELDFGMGSSAGTSSSILGGGGIELEGASLPSFGSSGAGGGAAAGEESIVGEQTDNPIDGLDQQQQPSAPIPDYTYSGDPENPVVGDTVTAPSICEAGQVTFYRVDPTVPGGKVIAAQATSTYTMVINDIDKSVYAEVSCPDPSSPTGYGEPIQLGPTPIIASGCDGIEGIEYNGTVPPPDNTIGAPITLVDGPITTRSYATSPNTCDAAINPPSTSAERSVTLQNVKGIELVAVPGTCGGTKQLLWRVTFATGTIQDRNITQIGDNRGYAFLEGSVNVTWDHPSAVPYCP